jgi:hypothetical protein
MSSALDAVELPGRAELIVVRVSGKLHFSKSRGVGGPRHAADARDTNHHAGPLRVWLGVGV